jgi:hypothetical protein
MPKLIVRAIGVLAVVLAICAGIAFSFKAYLGPGMKCEEHGVSQTVSSANQKTNAPPGPSVQHLIPPDQSQNPTAQPKDHYYECLVAKYTSELASFTEILAFVTSLLVVITAGVVWTSYRQETMARTHERAYISGGGPLRLKDPKTGDFIDPDKGWITIENYGRTQAIIKKIEWGFCDEKIFPKDRTVSEIIDRALIPKELIQVIEKEDVHPPNTPFRQYAAPGPFSLSQQDGKIFFGRYTYLDVFHDVHYSTFALKLGPGIGESYAIPGGYSDWN